MAETTERQGEFADRRVALIGAGVMGEALLSGLLRSGRPASQIVVADRSPERLMAIAEKYSVSVGSGPEAAADATTVVIAVKPQDMAGLLREVGQHLKPGALVVSIAAGITTAFLEEHLPEGTPVARVMPNTPALVDEGMTAVSAGAHCETHHLWEAQDLMRGCGKVVSLSEDQLDAVTAISGSGPAYIFYVVEAMIEAGVLLGLPRGTSTELVVQTLYGAATMLKETGEHPTVLREQVSSPGGTTMAALRELDDHKVRAAFLTAMEAAAKRSHDLASGHV
ncbi:pyrroline-5-carboxylate reductase [Flexivirga sp. ID2601S]|uniref:Pyrroline-5-carboxylate reductase n=1 Tax=Flexivirga aerilata TaxID=1656889 RepID=A0A849AM94_9MICO|nr:pyrroline-5-carboxylate reductase [Flexivirga aerilata]NNG37932.1 pyrroline-5-carboxylate reductase [Flexivirga aerilata]